VDEATSLYDARIELRALGALRMPIVETQQKPFSRRFRPFSRRARIEIHPMNQGSRRFRVP